MRTIHVLGIITCVDIIWGSGGFFAGLLWFGYALYKGGQSSECNCDEEEE